MNIDEMLKIKDMVFMSGRQTWKTMIIDDMSNIMYTVFILKHSNIKGNDHRFYVEHQAHSIYLCDSDMRNNANRYVKH